MFNFFKTKYSIHHPFENKFNNKLLKHPSNTLRYENKICPLGNYVGLFLLLWFIFRYNINNNIYNSYNRFIICSITIGSLVMNLNAFLYLIPLLLIEYSCY